jgi:hypothetical protein
MPASVLTRSTTANRSTNCSPDSRRHHQRFLGPSGICVGYDRFTAATQEVPVAAGPSHPPKGMVRSIASIVAVTLAPWTPSHLLRSARRIRPTESPNGPDARQRSNSHPTSSSYGVTMAPTVLRNPQALPLSVALCLRERQIVAIHFFRSRVNY